MLRKLREFVGDVSGATAIEYALIGSLIALAIIAGSTTIGRQLGTTFNGVGNNLK